MEFQDNLHFAMYLNFCIKESSHDSHTDCFVIEIMEKEVKYTWDHFGFPNTDRETKKFILDNDRFNTLIEYIKNKQLNRDIIEIKPKSNLGVSIDIVLKIKMENKITSVLINGMYDDWKLRKTGNYCNIENHIYFHYADRIVSLIKDWK